MLRSRRTASSRSLLVAAAVALGSVSAVAAWGAETPAAETSVVGAPVWIRMPKGDDFARVYPITARQQGLAGGATMTCRIDAKGLLNTCTVANEAPARAGFGQAALALAPTFQMAGADQTGVPTRGNQVAIPIRFVAPTLTGSRLRSVGF